MRRRLLILTGVLVLAMSWQLGRRTSRPVLRASYAVPYAWSAGALNLLALGQRGHDEHAVNEWLPDFRHTALPTAIPS